LVKSAWVVLDRYLKDGSPEVHPLSTRCASRLPLRSPTVAAGAIHVRTFKQTEQSIDAYRKEGAMRDGRHSTHMCLGLVVAAIVTTSLSKTPADLLTTLGTPAVVAAQTGNDTGDKPKGTVWVVNRDLGQLAIFDAAT